jgi:hypothetical protein
MRSRAALASFALLLSGGLCSGCDDVPTDETPRGTVRLFLSAIERSRYDESALREAHDLLCEDARRGLRERAHASLGGDRLEPWDMLVPGRSRIAFTPADGARGMRERIDGDRATVIVTNGDRRAEVPLVREHGRWRIVIELPPFREAQAPRE